MKKAIILFNLGGPDKLENVEPFLFNLFNDPAILNLPSFLRYPLAKLISNRRAPTAKKIYQELGGSSPILKLTNEQSNALEKKLNQENDGNLYRCFVVMRCWHPRAEKVIDDVKLYNPDEIILLPLYPQYSAATSGYSIKEWNDICLKKIYSNKIEIGKVLINKEYPFALIKFLDKNFDKKQIFKSENGTFKILIPEWLKI